MTKQTKSKHARASYLAAAILVLIPTLATPGDAAQDFAFGERKPFSLKATVDDRYATPAEKEAPQLSRDDVAIVPPQAQPNITRFDLGADQGITLPDQPQQAQEQQSKEQPASSMIEYGVDWSKWVSQLADRWFYNLKVLEDQSGLQFHTSRPCLIKFTCYPNGAIAEITLKQTSGVQLYDHLQAQALLQCQPVAAFPHGTQRTSFTLVQGWESHPKKVGEHDYKPGSFGHGFPVEVVKQWMNGR